MKRLLGMLLCICILLAGQHAAMAAEQFKLRSGIKFGDTIDEIVEEETTLTREDDDSHTFRGKIAGYDDAACIFSFDDDEKLEDMQYYFDSSVCYSHDRMADIYTKLYQSLVRKYGSAIRAGTVN